MKLTINPATAKLNIKMVITFTFANHVAHTGEIRRGFDRLRFFHFIIVIYLKKTFSSNENGWKLNEIVFHEKRELKRSFGSDFLLWYLLHLGWSGECSSNARFVAHLHAMVWTSHILFADEFALNSHNRYFGRYPSACACAYEILVAYGVMILFFEW